MDQYHWNDIPKKKFIASILEKLVWIFSEKNSFCINYSLGMIVHFALNFFCPWNLWYSFQTREKNLSNLSVWFVLWDFRLISAKSCELWTGSNVDVILIDTTQKNPENINFRCHLVRSMSFLFLSSPFLLLFNYNMTQTVCVDHLHKLIIILITTTLCQIE